MKQIVALLLLAVAGVHTVSAADLGDKAPEIQIATWVKGQPASVTGDGTYVVEFWATWCGPCRQSIPHLTEMQKKFKNVTFIGVSDEKEPVVKKFVKEMGDKMDYRVAIDDDRKTSANYMEAFGINGIPHAFVVKDKKIIWQGHPMDHLDDTLDDIVAGKYDISKAKARAQVQKLYEAFQEAAFNGKEAEADSIAEKLTASAKDVKGVFPDDKFDPAAEKKRLRTMMLQNQFARAVAQGEDSKADDLAKDLKKLDPEIKLDEIRGRVQVSKFVQQYFQAATGQENADKAAEIGQKMADKLQGQPGMANEIAWAILTNEQIKKRDIPLALKISQKGCEDSNWKDPQIIDTYARALFESGKKDEAIDYQKKAIAAVPEAEARKAYEETLKKYQESATK
jgi:thiol-disulfide isomerase/thioredoxin